MACLPAPACKAVLAQASARWPSRSRASDGICPSAAHTSSNPTSDHERGNAVDLTHDPANGCDAHAWANWLASVRRDPRVKYIISNGMIWNPSISPNWRPYSGSNPHTKHVHVSIHAGLRTVTADWFSRLTTTPPPTPTLKIEYPEDKMRSHTLTTPPLDAAGNGWVELPIPAGRIVNVLANGADAASLGRYPSVPAFAPYVWGSGCRIEIKGGEPGGRHGYTVWEITG